MFSRKPRRSTTSGEVSDQSPKSPPSDTETSASPLSSPDDPGRKYVKDLPHTKEYEYEEQIIDGKKRHGVPGLGFKYENGSQRQEEPIAESYDKSPGLRKSTATAFNYAPGDGAKVVETVEKRRLGELGGGDEPFQRTNSPYSEIHEFGLPEPPVSPTRSPISKFVGQARSPTLTGPVSDVYSGSPVSTFVSQARSPTQAASPTDAYSRSPVFTYVNQGRSPTQSSTVITTPEKDKEFDIASFGNDNKFVSPIILGQRKTPSPIQFNRPWGTGSPAVGSEPFDESMTHKERMASIFAQPGYTTSFLNSPTSQTDGEGMGFQNKHFQATFPTQPPLPLSTSTPVGSKIYAEAPFVTPIRDGISESMITHPRTTGSPTSSPRDTFEWAARQGRRSRSKSSSSEDSQRLSLIGKARESSSSSSSDDEDSIVKKFLKRENGRYDQILRGAKAPSPVQSSGSDTQSKPKIVKTTTKQTVVKDADGVRHDVHEKVEHLGTGRVLLSTTSNQVGVLTRSLTHSASAN